MRRNLEGRAPRLAHRLPALLALVASTLVAACGASQQPVYDVVIAGGRVMDPESGLDAVRDVGIRGGKIAALGERPLLGKTRLDAKGLVVAPGFIDMHEHGQHPLAYSYQVRDGVTTSLELEIGVPDVDAFYAEREGKTVVNFGATVSHPGARIAAMHDPSTTLLPTGDAARRNATPAEEAEILRRIEHGLERGALGVGLGLQYTPGASREEILEVFRTAAKHPGAPVFVHLRYMGLEEPTNALTALQEMLGDAQVSGAPLHVVHIHSSGLKATPILLGMVAGAREHGLDVTTEAYPYDAGETLIESALFDDGWQTVLGITYGDLEWPKTNERLTAESFARYRKEGGEVILHFIPADAVEAAITSPLTAIASDGGLEPVGTGHPRATGTFARVLGRFVRERKALDLMTALRKMTLLPAQRLEKRDPAMRDKGRIRVGADADVTVFDPATVEDRSTYGHPLEASAGIRFVLVNGVPVVIDGKLRDGVFPGKPVRAPVERPKATE
ncbi:MAG: amidohydrolase family protein [Gemmatimonadetes bacterium]|nr:amidohydrolase family protein [Gemmatimonadota bacterium]